MDILFRVLHLQKQHLSNDGIRHAIINAGTNANDTVLEQAGLDVERTFTAAVRFDNGRDVVVVYRCRFHGELRCWIDDFVHAGGVVVLCLSRFSFDLCFFNLRVLDGKVAIF